MPEPQLEQRALRILVVDDEENIRFALSVCLEADGNKVVAVGNIQAALEETARQAFDLIFLDLRLGTQNGLDYIQSLLRDNPWARLVVITAYASIETAVQAMQLGASDYLAKPFEPAQLRHLTQKVAARRMLERQVESLQKALGAMDAEGDFVTDSRLYREAIEFARRLAPTNAAVLIHGETGTGRSRLARAIHHWSYRSQGPFATFSFEGKSPEQIELQLFGSGPDEGSEVGAIAFCHGGTLLLDEISQLPIHLQSRVAMLLREKEFERKDQIAPRPVDVRIIATTSVDLDQLSAAKVFRNDLLMAFSVAELDLPALRERSEDISSLANRYLAYFAREHHRSIGAISEDAMYVLAAHVWPGNVRELRNVIERSVLLCNGDTITLDHLPADLINSAAKSRIAAVNGHQVGDLVPLDLIEQTHIMKVVASSKTLRRAASILGVNYSALSRKLSRLQSESVDEKPEK